MRSTGKKNVTFFLVAIFLALFVVESWGGVFLTNLTLKEKKGIATTNYPLTFGHVFPKGAVFETVTVKVGETALPTQCDVKVTWPDGSIRHAVISVIVPKIEARTELVLALFAGGSNAKTGFMTKAQILETDIGATINLGGLSGSGYSGPLTADLRAAINATLSLDYWLSGGICTEVLVNQRLNNSLNATWEVRFYPGTPYIRISHAIENIEINYRGNIQYTASIEHGSGSPEQVYPGRAVKHLAGSRWRKVLWLDAAPPEVEIHYNLPYLISTGHIPNYDTQVIVDPAAIAAMSATWDGRDTEIYGTTDIGGNFYSGLATCYFPATGGRSEIGLLPKWTAMYLLSWDNRLRDIMLGQAELLANAPVHWRETDGSKPFSGHVLNIDDYPRVRCTSDYDFTRYGDLPASIGTTDTSPWVVDGAHQGSFNYIPYLITGEKFYLDEMYYWAGWNLSSLPVDPGWGRDWSKGFIRDQVRGEAWRFRNIVHAAVMAPDGAIEKPYFDEKISSNIEQWVTDIQAFPLRNWESNLGINEGFTSDAGAGTSPWMDDFMSLVLKHAKDLGYATTPVLDEQQKFIIGRFSQPDFNWYNGAAYRFPTAFADGSPVTTWAEANTLMAEKPTSFQNPDYPFSYRFIALASLSGLNNYPKGRQAYEWLKRNTHSLERFSEDPTWALLPRGPKAPTWPPE